MLQLAISGIFIVVIVFVNEYASRQKLISGELARKIPHIALSVVFAVMPFFIGLHRLALLATVDIVIAIFVHRFNWFKFSRTIDRKTWGDFFFLFGTIIAALLTRSRWVFAAAILTMGFADAAAALIGKSYGKHHFKVFDNTKSLEGSLAFVIVAFCIATWVVFVTPAGLSSNWLIVILLPLATSVVEAVAPFGLDNMLVPIFVALVLNWRL
jgi:phytol kinase